MCDPLRTRRDFLRGVAGAAGLGLATPRPGYGFEAGPGGVPADVTLRIAPLRLEIAPGRTVDTTAYNGSVPGPLIRLRENAGVTVDLFNDTDDAEYVHWHGFVVPTDVDGTEEERSLVLPAHGRLRYRLVPTPAGSRYVHSHAMSMGSLHRGTFSGQFGFVYIEPRSDPGQYDQEIFLATHEWSPYLVSMDGRDGSGTTHGLEAAYRDYTINGKCLGSGEPIRVKEGERVLIHFLNASATETARFALPGHRFRVVALDGHPVPRPQLVDVLEMATAERIDAIVEMKTPGVWILGTPNDSDRAKGMGIVVEYAGHSGLPQWVKPPEQEWSYATFGVAAEAPRPYKVIPLTFGQIDGTSSTFEQWTLNGKLYDAAVPPTTLIKGVRNRLVLDNPTDDDHPVHLHRAVFEVVRIDGFPTSGIVKDVVVVKRHQIVEIDVIPEVIGLMLFHCHQQLHMDYGFKLVFDAA